MFFGALAMVLVSCSKAFVEDGEDDNPVSLEDVAGILSSGALSLEHIAEVHDAVSASERNGYDAEYTMANIFDNPGAGVGDERLTKADMRLQKTYSSPLRDVFRNHFSALSATKSGGADDGMTAEKYLEYIRRSDMQIYWPNSESWDGATLPVITFDPLNGLDTNVGYCLDSDGEIQVISVDEQTAMERPVWVISNNDDARYTSIDILRRNDPQWGMGGSIIVNPTKSDIRAATSSTVKCLLLKNIVLKRNFDNWFQGGSELVIRVGSVESFSGVKESDLDYFNPSITEFMVVIRRSQIGQEVDVNTLLVSEWTSQLQNSALMIIEDDGGTVTSWKCNAVVKINSKSYGFEVELPYKSKDDIVWRGQLSRKYIEATDEVSANFGECQLTFDIKQL